MLMVNPSTCCQDRVPTSPPVCPLSHGVGLLGCLTLAMEEQGHSNQGQDKTQKVLSVDQVLLVEIDWCGSS